MEPKYLVLTTDNEWVGTHIDREDAVEQARTVGQAYVFEVSEEDFFE